jgi:hypothetical protein
LSRVCKGISICVDDLALNLVGPATVISQAASNHTNITLGHSKSLSIVQRLNSSQEVDVLLDQVGKVDQKPSSVFWSLLSPRAVESLACGSYGNIDILLGGLVDGADNLFC